jgi:peptidyl-prolyl cis-trans isomerase C
MQTGRVALCIHGLCALTLVLGLMSLTACNGKAITPGQTLARVNGDEVTTRQLNDEFGSAESEKSGPSREQARKQVLEALVDRQLLVGEAMRSKLDRDPIVVNAMARVKAQILAQAYLQSRVANVSIPTKADVEIYFQTHPELFSERKIYEMRQLVIASQDFSEGLRAVMDKAKSLDDAIAWLDLHKVEYVKTQVVRNSFELPQQVLSKMQSTEKAQLFVLKDVARCLLMSINYIKDSPVAFEDAGPEIAQFLINKKKQEVAERELKRLRLAAKLDYLNQEVIAAAESSAPVASDIGAKVPVTVDARDAASVGVAILK